MFRDALLRAVPVMRTARGPRGACALLCLLSITLSAPAATVRDLHSATVPVADNSEAELARGLEAAFEVIVTRLTGDSTIARQSAVARLRSRARQYNTLFGYARAADGSLLLRADFDLPAVSGALRERGYAVWGRERPEISTWLVVRDATGAWAAATEPTAEIFDAFTRHAERRAIPLRRRVPDASLRSLLTTVTRDDELLTALDTLAAGDGTTPRLVMLLTQDAMAATWHVRWQFAVDAERANGEGQGSLPVPVLTEHLDRALDTLARHYLAGIPAGGGVEDVDIVVDDVRTPDAYGRTLAYLDSLDGVRAVEVVRLEGTSVFLRVNAYGGLPALAQTIGFGRVLGVVPEVPGHFRVVGP